MAIPTVVGNVSLTAAVGAVTKAWPGGIVTDDVAFLFVQRANQAASLSVPSGFVLLHANGTGVPGAAGATGLSVFGCRATSSVMPDVTVAAGGDHNMASMLVIRGIPRTLPLTSILIVSDVLAAPGDAAPVAPASSSSADDALILVAVAHGIDTTTPQFSAWTNADFALPAATELQDGSSNPGVGGGLGIADGGRQRAGAFGTTTATMVAASAQVRMVITLPSTSPVSPAFVAQVAAILAFGPPYEIDGIVYDVVMTLDFDCLVFSRVGPVVDPLAPATTVRAVINLNDVSVFRGRNAP